MFEKITSKKLHWWLSGILYLVILSWLVFPFERTKRWIDPSQFKVGEIIHRTLISPLEVSYPDLEATQKAKEQAVEDTPLVYDLSLERLADAEGMFDEIADTRERNDLSKSQKASAMRRLIIGESLTAESSTILALTSAENFETIRSGVKQILKEILSKGVVRNLTGHDSDSFAQDLEKLQMRGELWKQKYSELSLKSQREASDLEVALQMPLKIRVDGKDIGLIRAGELYDWNGAVLEADRRSHTRFSSNNDISQTASEICKWFIRPNLRYNGDETDLFRQASSGSVKSVMKTLHAGERIISRGDLIAGEHLKMLESITKLSDQIFILAAVGVALAVIFLMAILAIYIRAKDQLIIKNPRKVMTLCLLLALPIALGRICLEYIPISQPALLIPTALTGMIVAIVISSQLAILSTVVLSVLVGIMAGPNFHGILEHFAVSFFGGIVAIFSVYSVRKRSDLIKAALYVTIANSAAIISIAMIKNYSLSMFLENASAVAVNGAIVGMLSPGLLLIFENLSQSATDIELLELSDLNHPLLAELKAKAPGSYYHSMEVSNLCEASAEAIGANTLLARVGSYYHDIGKMNMPKYFIENQSGDENVHEKISPYTSARVIASHVKDGIELAKEHKLPKIIEDLIPQHHGTTMISFFYQKALEAEDGEDIDEKDYRYPGPKPQTKEAGIMLIADSIEASSRNLRDPSPEDLRNLVEDIINQKLIDSQLDESNLTLKDLRLIADSFVKVLNGSLHTRIEYPQYSEKDEEESALKLKAVMTSRRASHKNNGLDR